MRFITLWSFVAAWTLSFAFLNIHQTNKFDFKMRATKHLETSTKKLSVYRSTSTNPFVNLAVESWLYTTPKDANEHTLFLWRNAPSVIIGNFQSAWRECNIQKMNDEKVNLVRRSSGGGAVYQDLGNSIFSFLSPREVNVNDGILRNNNILLKALKTLNIDAVSTGRNDIHFNGRKISGAAFKHTKDRSLHHGTLLLNVDMTALSRYLTPNKLKLQSKGVSSVEAHVLNLKTVIPDITHDAVGKAITTAFFDHHGDTCEIIDIDETAIMKTEEKVRTVVEQLQDWDWRFGSKEPQFTHQLDATRLSWGTFDVNFVVKKGVVENVAIYCDALDVPLVESIQQCLQGQKYSHESLKKALDGVIPQLMAAPAATTRVQQLQEFTDWLIAKL